VSSLLPSIRLSCAGGLVASLAGCGSVSSTPVDAPPAVDASVADAGLRSCAATSTITTIESADDGYGGSCIRGSWTLEALNGTTSPVAVGQPGNTALVAPTALTAGQNTLDATSTFAVHVTGSGQQNTATGSSYAQLNASLNAIAPGDFGVVDASAFTGIQFDAIINTGPDGVRLTVADLYTDPIGGKCSSTPTSDKSDCFDHPGVHLATSTAWKHYKVAFADLTQLGFGLPSPTGPSFPKQAITRIKWDLGIASSGPTPDWELWIDNLAFY